MKAALTQLDHIVAIAAFLPFAALCNIYQKLYVRIAWTKTFVTLALAPNASFFFAEYATGNVADDFPWSNEFGAMGVGAIGGIGCR
jgi:hypothetical protein